jgi:hypothetical protein
LSASCSYFFEWPLRSELTCRQLLRHSIGHFGLLHFSEPCHGAALVFSHHFWSLAMPSVLPDSHPFRMHSFLRTLCKIVFVFTSNCIIHAFHFSLTAYNRWEEGVTTMGGLAQAARVLVSQCCCYIGRDETNKHLRDPERDRVVCAPHLFVSPSSFSCKRKLISSDFDPLLH